MIRVLCLATGLMLSAPVVAVPEWLIPSPISIVIQVGKWIATSESEKPVYYIRVQSTGINEADARDQAFRLAIDQAVGSLMVSETEISDGSLQRHDLINYSSGYIQDFEYVNIHRSNDGVTIQMDVWVKQSSIADRIRGTAESSENIQGYKISESFRSKDQQQSAADTLLANILNEYPAKAFNHAVHSIEYTEQNRTPYMIVHFEVQWNTQYLTSLEELFDNIGNRVDSNPFTSETWNMQFVETNCIMCNNNQYLLENTHANTMINRLNWHSPAMRVVLLDKDANTLIESCGWYDAMIGNSIAGDNLYEHNGAGFDIYKGRALEKQFVLDLSGVDIKRLDRVVLTATSIKHCRNQ